VTEKKIGPPSEFIRLSKQCHEDSIRWFGDTSAGTSLTHQTLALAGEVGEFANIVKKVERHSLRLGDADVRWKLMMELTDVFIYTLNLAALLNIDLSKSYEHVRGLNEKRFVAERIKREAEAS
jgi:NTP pyrophosphatase (non-canonical NTP hydrolase)